MRICFLITTCMKVVIKEKICSSFMFLVQPVYNVLSTEQEILLADIHLNVTTKETINVQMLK